MGCAATMEIADAEEQAVAVFCVLLRLLRDLRLSAFQLPRELFGRNDGDSSSAR